MPLKAQSKPFLLVVGTIVITAAALAWGARQYVERDTSVARVSDATREIQTMRRSLEAIAAQLGDAGLYPVLQADANGDTADAAEVYITPSSSISILKPDKEGGVVVQELPAIPDSGYRVVELTSGTQKIWRIQLYNGYMRADPKMSVVRR